MSRLVPCAACSRHVLSTERGCPFCGAELPANVVPAPPLPKARLGRAAMFAAGATLVGVGACKEGTTSTDAASDRGAITDAGDTGGTGAGGSSSGGAGGGTAGATGTAGTTGTGGLMGTGGGVLYGAPPIDASVPADAAEDRNFMPIYGLSGMTLPKG